MSVILLAECRYCCDLSDNVTECVAFVADCFVEAVLGDNIIRSLGRGREIASKRLRG